MHMKHLLVLLCKCYYIGEYGVSELFSAKEDENKLCFSIFRGSNILLEAAEAG